MYESLSHPQLLLPSWANHIDPAQRMMAHDHLSEVDYAS